MLLCSCANKNFFFWRLSNDCQIVRPALVSGPPNRKKPYNKHLISLVFSVRTVNYGSSFFPSICGPRASRLEHKSMEKNSVRNLQYGPKTRLIRGMNAPRVDTYFFFKTDKKSPFEKISEYLWTGPASHEFSYISKTILLCNIIVIISSFFFFFQSTWRRYKDRSAYLLYRKRKWAAGNTKWMVIVNELNIVIIVVEIDFSKLIMVY